MGSIRRKTGKYFDHVAMYPARADEDEDDIQHFKHPQTESEKREHAGKKAYEYVDKERHMPDDAVVDSENEDNEPPPPPEEKDPRESLAEANAGDQGPGPAAKRKQKQRPQPYRKRNKSAIPIKTRVSDYAYNPEALLDDPFGFQPRPFEELISEITEWEIKSDPAAFKRFPFHTQKSCDYQWLCLGKRRTGKTTLWRNVIPHIYKMYPIVYIFAQTSFTGAFHSYVPEDAIFGGYSEGALWNLLKAQEEKIKINLRLYDKFAEFEDTTALQNIPNPYVHINFDDTVAQKGVHDSEALNEFAYYGRHYCFSTWINSQHGHALNPGFLPSPSPPG